MTAAELAQLRKWKGEALQVIAGLQEVGHALGIPPGQSITGRDAVDAALDLRNARDAAIRERDARWPGPGQGARWAEVMTKDDLITRLVRALSVATGATERYVRLEYGIDQQPEVWAEDSNSEPGGSDGG